MSENGVLRARSALSLRTQIVALILVLALPIIGFSAFMMLRLAEAERNIDQTQNLSNARAISFAIDQQLMNAEAALDVLAVAPALRDRDYGAFYQQSLSVARRYDARILLIDPSGHQIFNTERPLGTTLPNLRIFEPINAAVQTQKAQVSDLLRAVTTGDYQVAVYRPVVEDGAVPLLLVIGIRPESLSRIFTERALPEQWTIAIIDRNGLFVGRNKRLGLVLGQPVTADLRAAMAANGEGLAMLFTKEGTEVYTAFTRSAYSGWTVALGVPRSEIEAPLRRSLVEIGSGGALILVLSASAALWITRRLSQSMRGLAAAALALGGEERPPIAASRVKEIDTVIAAMRTASSALLDRAADRDRAEQALRKSEAHLQQAQQLGSTGSFEWHFGVEVGHWSPEVYRIFGVDPAAFTPTLDSAMTFVHQEDRAKVLNIAHNAAALNDSLEFRIVRPTGEVRTVRRTASGILDSAGLRIGTVGTVQDITEMRKAEDERRQLERRLERTQRMEALGTLAGGIAHDLNNTMVPVIALAKALQRRFIDDPSVAAKLDLIHRAGCRARDLVKQILAFSRKETPRKECFDFATFVGDTLQMLRASVPATVEISYRAPSGLPPVVGDPSQLHQVLINLVTNAVQAVGDRPGSIAISLALGDHDDTTGRRELRLVVRDNGSGMDKATMERIFDPFFTTKDVGEGTGLGLSVSHSIVTGHGGRIEVESELGLGTAFTVVLPEAEPIASVSPLVVAASP